MLRPGYTGGSVDVYRPFNPQNKLVYGYDINSMYPAVMGKYDFPVGNPVYFEGDRDIVNDNLFGFVKVRVTCPLDIKMPLLQPQNVFTD